MGYEPTGFNPLKMYPSSRQVPRDEAAPGDLYFWPPESDGVIPQVGIYNGDGQVSYLRAIMPVPDGGQFRTLRL